MDKLDKLYSLYLSKGLITEATPIDKFKSASDQQRAKLYELGKTSGLFATTDLNTFSSAWGGLSVDKKKEESALPSREEGTSLATPKMAGPKPLASSRIKQVKNPSSFNKNIESSDYQRHTKLASVAINAADKGDKNTLINTLKEMNAIRSMYPAGVFESDKQMSEDLQSIEKVAGRKKLDVDIKTASRMPVPQKKIELKLPQGVQIKASDIKQDPEDLKRSVQADLIELEALDFERADKQVEEEFAQEGISDKVLRMVNKWTVGKGWGYIPTETEKAIAKATNEVKSNNPDASAEDILAYAKEQRKKELLEVQKDKAVEDYFEGKAILGRPEEQVNIERSLENIKSKQEYHIAKFNEKNQEIERNLSTLELYNKKIENKEELTPEDVNNINYAVNNVNLLYDDLQKNYKNIETDDKDLKNTAEEIDRFKRNYSYVTNAGARVGNWAIEATAGLAGYMDMQQSMLMGGLKDATGVDVSQANIWDDISKSLSGTSESIKQSIAKNKELKNVNSIGDFAEWSGQLVLDQAPQIVLAMATGGAAVPLMGASAAGSKFEEIKDDEKYTMTQKVVASYAVGLAEALSEKIELDVIKYAFPSSRIAKAAAKTKADEEILKQSLRTGIKGATINNIEKLGMASLNVNKEGISEVVAQLGTNLTDRYILDKKDVSILDGIDDAYLSGAVIGGAMIAAPAFASKVISPFVYDPEKNVSKNVSKIAELTKALGIATKGSDKKIIQGQIDKLNNDNFSIVDAAINRTKNLSPDEIREGVRSIERMQEIKSEITDIRGNASYSTEAKNAMVSGLLDEYNQLVLKRKQLIDKANAVQEQATSEVPIQPEARVGEEVAQGKPQAEPQVFTKEGVQEEVVIDKPTISTNSKVEVDKVVSATPETETGQTFNSDGTVYADGGLVIPVVSENLTQEELTPERIAEFTEKHKNKIGSKAVKIGIYKFPNSNQVSIDLNIVVPRSNREIGIEFGRIAGQESLFDLDTFENIKTGSDGKNPMTFTDEQFKEISKALEEGRMPEIAAQPVQQAVAQNIQETDENYQESRDAVMQIAQDQKEFVPGDAVLEQVTTDDKGNVTGGVVTFLDADRNPTRKTISRAQTAPAKTGIVENVKKAIGKLFPKLEAKNFNSAAEMREYARSKYGDAVADQVQDDDAARVLLDQNNEPIAILINDQLSDETTLPHEAWHPIMLKAFGDNQKLFSQFRAQIKKALIDNGFKDIADQLDAFANQEEYKKTGVDAEEWLVQFGALLTNKKIDASKLTPKQKSLIEKLRDIINSFMSKVSGQPVFNETSSAKDILDFMASIADSMAKGEDISGLFEVEGVDKTTEVKSRSQKAAIEILDGPKFDNKLKEDVASYLNSLRDSEIPPNSSREQLMERFINNVYEEVGYYLFSKPDARSAGLTWYIEDMVEFENKVKVIIPELSNEKQYKLFLSILAFTSSGTNPNQNLSYAYNLWNNSNDPKNFDFSKDWGDKKLSFVDKKGKAVASGVIVKETAKEYTVELVDSLGRPEVDSKGNKKYEKISKASMKPGYPKPTGYTNRGKIIVGQLEKLEKLYSDLKSIDAVVKWLETPHPIAELRKYNEAVPDVNGKGPGKTNKKYDPSKNADGERNGAFIFGEKIGSFYQNMIGIGETITMDLWWSRTWNRYMGTMINTTSGNKEIQEVPRSDRERNIMREAVKMVAEDLNLQVSELQAAIWYFEQELWTKSGNASPSYSYVTAIDELTEKLKVDEETRTKLRSAEADLTEAEKRRKNAAERAAAVVASKGGEIPKVKVTTRAQKSIEQANEDFGIEDGEAMFSTRAQKLEPKKVSSLSSSIQSIDKETTKKLKSLINKGVKEPKKTQKAYKLFKVKKEFPGELFPLFVGANESVTVGEWIEAKAGELTTTKEGKTMVKSTLGPLAYRPGWHSGDLAIATHIGSKRNPTDKAPTLRAEDQVWAEVEVGSDVDWQKEATSRAEKTKDGRINLRTAHITDQVPLGGFYKYKTNSNMTGSWIISGEMKVNRVLTDKEVNDINKKGGGKDLPRLTPFDYEAYGFNVDGSVKNPKNVLSNQIARAYLVAKETGENEELVNAVENALKINTKAQKAPKYVPESVYKYLTEDADGNIVFHHYSKARRDEIKPSTGSGSFLTSREEQQALSSVGGLGMYYTQQGQKEPGVGDERHTVVVPKEKIYYMTSDPLNLYDEARARFLDYMNRNNDVQIEYAFNPNYQTAWITKVAQEKGFDMVISKWKNDADYRAQSSIALKPIEEDLPMKDIEDNIEVGDRVFVSGAPAIITSIDENGLATYKQKNSSGKFDIELGKRTDRYGKMTLLDKGPFEMTEDGEIVPAAITTRGQKASRERMMNELDGVIAKSRDRKVSKETVYNNALAYLQGSKVYEEADDVERESLVRELRKKLGLKEKSVSRIFSLKRKDNGITVGELKLINRLISEQVKGAKSAIQARQKVAAMIKDQLSGMFKKGIIKTSQLQAINRKLLQLNFLNQDHVDKFINYMDKVFRDSEYADKLSRANALQAKIKRSVKDKTIQAETRDTAKEFSKLAPYLATDIDAYIAAAEEVYEAVQQTKGTVTDGIANVTFKKAMNYERVQEYTKNEAAAQEEARKQQLIEKNKYLLEAGVLDESMSLKEMMSIIASIEADPGSEAAKDKQKIIRDYVNKYFDSYRTILEEIIRTDIDPFTGERMYLTDAQRKQVGKFLEVDLNVLSLKDAYNMVNAIDNFVMNQNTDGMEATIAAYEGKKNNIEAQKRNLIARPLRAFWSKTLGRNWGEQFEQITMMHERMFGGVERAIEFDRLSGLSKLLTDKVKALKSFNAIVENYANKFGKIKDFNKAENVFERGMLGIVARNVQGSETEQQEEFNKQKKNIEISIKAMEKGTDKQKKEAVVARKVYDKILKDSNSYQEARSKAGKENVMAVEFWQNAFANIFDSLQDVSRGVYNTILDRDVNYLPHTYKRFGKAEDKTDISEEGSAFMGINEGFDTKETGVLMKATKPKLTETSTPSRILSFDFDTNMSRAIQGALIDINTASTIRQISSFYSSEGLEKIIPRTEDRDMAIRRMKSFIKKVKKKDYVQEDSLDTLAKAANYISSFSASRALGSISQIPKQTISVAANTMINTGGNIAIFDVFKAKDFIDNSGYGISIRGIASQADIQSINQILKKAEESKGKQALDYLKKLNDMYLELFVASPDVYIARASWLAYYKKKLKSLGVDTDNIDWSTHEINTEAGDYAQRMTDRQQNFSDSDLAGEIMSNKKPVVQLLRKSLFPFASFGINKKAQLMGDMSVLYNPLSSSDDKKAAVASLASWGVEMAVYSGVSIFIGNVVYNFIANLMADYEEDEEEKEKKYTKAIQYRAKNAVVELLSPIPNVADDALVDGINFTLNSVGVDEQYRLPEGKGEKLYEKVGLTNIMQQKMANLSRMTYAGATGTYVDKFGNEKEMSKEDQQRAASMAAVYAFYAFGFVPADFGITIDNAYYKLGKKSKKAGSGGGKSAFGSIDTKIK
jgi:hypothetical protein